MFYFWLNHSSSINSDLFVTLLNIQLSSTFRSSLTTTFGESHCWVLLAYMRVVESTSERSISYQEQPDQHALFVHLDFHMSHKERTEELCLSLGEPEDPNP